MNKRHQVTATVYDRKGRVLALGVNSYTKSHPEMFRLSEMLCMPFKHYLHAEVAAIIRARKRGKPYKIKVERYGNAGNPLNAKPCPICEQFIKENGIHFIEHTL